MNACFNKNGKPITNTKKHELKGIEKTTTTTTIKESFPIYVRAYIMSHEPIGSPFCGLGPESLVPPNVAAQVDQCPPPGLGPESLNRLVGAARVAGCPPPGLGPESLIPPNVAAWMDVCPPPGLGPESLIPPSVSGGLGLWPPPPGLGPDSLIAKLKACVGLNGRDWAHMIIELNKIASRRSPEALSPLAISVLLGGTWLMWVGGCIFIMEGDGITYPSLIFPSFDWKLLCFL